MEEAPENGKESSHSAHANGMNVFYENCLGRGFRVCYLAELKDTAVHIKIRNKGLPGYKLALKLL
jgi:hypothetical protein